MDFFYYAIVAGDNLNKNYNSTCQDTCGNGLFKEKCCAEVSYEIKNYEDEKFKDLWFVCINQSVAAAEISMKIADTDVSLKCA
jgi:hypothetical protein